MNLTGLYERMSVVETEVKAIKTWIKLLVLITIGSGTASIYL